MATALGRMGCGGFVIGGFGSGWRKAAGIGRNEQIFTVCRGFDTAESNRGAAGIRGGHA